MQLVRREEVRRIRKESEWRDRTPTSAVFIRDLLRLAGREAFVLAERRAFNRGLEISFARAHTSSRAVIESGAVSGLHLLRVAWVSSFCAASRGLALGDRNHRSTAFRGTS